MSVVIASSSLSWIDPTSCRRLTTTAASQNGRIHFCKTVPEGYLNSYIAIDRQFSIFNNTPLPDHTSGSALFADISGFTPLTSTLAREMGSQRGPEELNHQINSVFSALVNNVRQFHGSVVVFGGDAITCWFDQDDGAKGTACAMAMQESMRQFETIQITPSSSVSMHLKVAVVCGEARRFVVGDRSIQLIDVLAGHLLERLADAEKQLEKGEVIVGDEIAQLFGDQMNIRSWRTGDNNDKFAVVDCLNKDIAEMPWPAPPRLTDEVTKEWLHKPVFQRLLNAPAQFLAGLRPVTPLFVSFSGIDYDDDPHSAEKLDQVIQWLQQIAVRYGGLLISLNIGDKGSYCQLAFGAMVLHENDTIRAIAAAKDIQAPPTELEFLKNIKIGISRGIVYAGAYGGPDRTTYGTTGEDVNLCARLMSKANGGQILVTPAVVSIAADTYQFTAYKQTRLKGFAEPITLYSMSGDKQAQNRSNPTLQNSSPLVGRIAEKKLLSDALIQLLKQSSQVIKIQGDPGIGKSRIVADLIEHHDTQKIQCLNGAGNAIEINTAYHAWRPIFRTLYADEINTEAQHNEALVNRILGHDPELIPLAPLLNVVLPLSIPETDLTRQMTGSLRAFNIQSLLAALIRKAAEQQPLLIVMEDAHWMDSASWSLLTKTQDEVKPLLLVVATRPMETPPREMQLLEATPGFSLISLDNMDTDTIDGIVCNRLGAESLPAAIATFIHEKAGGNPFFSEELAVALRDNRLISVNDGKIKIEHQGDIGTIDFPDTIQGVIISRIDQLPPTSQLSLKIASIIGRFFNISEVSGIHPSEEKSISIKEQLNNPLEVDLVRTQQADPDSSYFFKHIITQEVAYNLLTFSQRRNLHQDAAELYEKLHARENITDYPVLAHHWLHAEVHDKAIESLDKAGAQALRRGAFREAIQFIEKAYSLSLEHGIDNEPVALARRRGDLGIAYLKTGNLKSSRENLEASLQHLNRPLPGDMDGIQKGIKQQKQRQFKHRMLPFLFVGSVKDKKTKEENIIAAKSYEPLAQIFYHGNDPVRYLYASLNLLNLAEQVGPSPQLTKAYGQSTNTASIMNRKRLSKVYSRLATKSLTADTPLTDVALTKEFVAIAWAGVGRWPEANKLSVEAMEISERLADHRRWNENISINALTRYPTGDAIESLRLREQLLAAGRRDGDIQIQGWALLEQAEIAIHQQRYDDAYELLKTAAELGPAIGRAEEIWLYGMFSWVNYQLGNTEDARTAGLEAYNRLSKGPPTAFYTLEGYSATVQLFITLSNQTGDPADLEMATDSLHHLNRFANVFTIGVPRASLWQGTLEVQAGNVEQALSTWKSGLKQATRMGMLYEQALLQCELAKHSNKESDRQIYLADAKSSLKIFGATSRLP